MYPQPTSGKFRAAPLVLGLSFLPHTIDPGRVL